MSNVHPRMAMDKSDCVYATGFEFMPDSVYIVARTCKGGVVVANDHHVIEIPVKGLRLGQTVHFKPMANFQPTVRQRNGFRTPSRKSIKKRLIH